MIISTFKFALFFIRTFFLYLAYFFVFTFIANLIIFLSYIIFHLCLLDLCIDSYLAVLIDGESENQLTFYMGHTCVDGWDA